MMLVAVGGVGELQAQDLGVVLGLLQALAGRLVAGLGLDDGDGEITGVAQQIVGPLLRAAANPLARRNDDPAIGERVLLGDGCGRRPSPRPRAWAGRTCGRCRLRWS